MKILLVQTGFLGDVILSTPVIERLQKLYPSASICMLTTPQAAPLVSHHPALQKTLVMDKRGEDSGMLGLCRFAKRLRKEQFDMVFSLHKSWRTAFLLFLARIPKRFGFSRASGKFLYSATVPRSDLKHEVLRNLALLRAVGEEPSEKNASLHIEIPKEISARMESKLQSKLQNAGQKPLIAIAPGSVWATKRWTEEGFAGVASQLSERGYRVILLGGPSDCKAAKKIEEQSSRGILNLVGELTLLESAAALAQCKLLITNDSAPLHMASACKIPTLALFCATIPEFGYGPWQTRAEIVEVSGLYCRPCGSHGGNTCPTGTHACQEEITQEQVMTAAERLLMESNESK